MAMLFDLPTPAEQHITTLPYRFNSLLEKIEVYREKYRKRVRTDAIIDLLEVTLYIAENAERLDDPAMVKYFKENLYNVQLVDDIMSWPPDRVEAILGVLTSERERRIRLRIGR
jgi:hypothetical protein